MRLLLLNLYMILGRGEEKASFCSRSSVSGCSEVMQKYIRLSEARSDQEIVRDLSKLVSEKSEIQEKIRILAEILAGKRYGNGNSSVVDCD